MEKEEDMVWIRAYRAAGFAGRRRVCPRLFLGCPGVAGVVGSRGAGVGFPVPVAKLKEPGRCKPPVQLTKIFLFPTPESGNTNVQIQGQLGDAFSSNEEFNGVAFELLGITVSVFHMLSNAECSAM